MKKKKRKREGLIILYFSSAVVNLFIESISARENMENVFLEFYFRFKRGVLIDFMIKNKMKIKKIVSERKINLEYFN